MSRRNSDVPIVGWGPIRRNRNNELVVDTEEIDRHAPKTPRTRQISGAWPDPDEEEDDDPDFEGDEDEDEEDEEEDDDLEVAGRRRQRRRRRRRGGRRKGRRKNRRNRDEQDGRPQPKARKGKRCFLGGSAKVAEGGEYRIDVRAQFDFEVEDMIVSSSVPGATIRNLKFAHTSTIDSEEGVTTEMFSSTSRVRESVEGHFVPAGLDIVMDGNLPDKGTINVTFWGYRYQ